MNDWNWNWNFSLNSTAAYTLWFVGAAFIVLDMATGLSTGQLGLLLAGMGGVLTIRTFFCQQARRERAAFDLGRESVRAVK